MKEDLFFVMKMFGLTVLVVMGMQVHTGGKTIEEHFNTWLKSSIIVDYMQEATDGGKILTQNVYKKLDTSFHAVMMKITRKKDRQKGLNVVTKTEEAIDRDVVLPYAKAHSGETR
jgi:hypothetical protein